MTLVLDSPKARGGSAVVVGREHGMFAPGMADGEDPLVLKYWKATFSRWQQLDGLKRWH